MSDWSKRNARALLKEFRRHGLATGVRIRNYRGEDLRGEVFDATDDLTGADFRGADLSDCRFPRGAALTGADLAGARLVGASLDEADLTGADLTGAVLDHASLIGADLRNTRIEGTTWHRARLTAARLPPGAAVTGWGAALPTHQPRLEFSSSGAINDLSWRTAGDLLAMARGARVEIWDLTRGTQITTLTGHTSPVQAVAWSPDGTRLATAGYDQVVRIWDPNTATQTTTLTGHTDWVRAVAWSPDGTRLATAGDDQVVRIWDPNTATQTTTLTGHTDPVLAVAWSPDGTRLATAGGDQVVRIWDPNTATQTTTLTGHTSPVLAVAWSPDGTRLATAGGDRVVRIWDRPPSRRGWLLLTRPLPRRLRSMLARRRQAPRRVVPVGDSAELACCSISPDGQRTAVAFDTGCIAFPKLDGPDQSETIDQAGTIRVLGLAGGGWAVFYGDHSYRLHGHPGGSFWWSSGLCRFEPGELDRHGIHRIE